MYDTLTSMNPTRFAISRREQAHPLRDQSSAFSKKFLLLTVATISLLIQQSESFAADGPAKVTYEDHIKSIFREHCTSCHNSNDKKSGLSLDTYQAVLAGGSGGEVVAAGDLDSSRLYGLTAHKEQPYMPPKQDMIPQTKVDLLKVWIEQGMPENSGSEIKKVATNSAALGIVSAGRPEGAPPMPKTMLKQTPVYTPKAATIAALAASPWSPLIAVGGQMQVSLYNSETGQLQGIIPFPEGEPQSITFSRDGKLILIAGGRHSVSGYAALHEIETGNRIARVGDELDIVLSADISDDNQLIALAGPQKMLRVFETLTGKLKYEQKKHTDWIYCVRFSPDGLLLATSDRSSGLVVWETQTGRLFLDLPGHKSEIRSIVWRPDSQALISGSLDGTMKLWDMNEGKQIKSWDAHGGGVSAVAVCNDGTMVSTGRDNKVKVWDSAGNAAGEMPGLVEAGHEVAITVDSKQIAAGDWLGNVRLWQRATPANEKILPANPLPLDEALAVAQKQLVETTAIAQQDQADFVAKESQQAAAQKQLTELQPQIAMLATQLQSATEQSNQLKLQIEQLTNQISAKNTELGPLKNSSAQKTNLVNTLAVMKKQADEAIVALQSLRTANGADTSNIDPQLTAQTTLSQMQAAAIAKLQSESQAMVLEIDTREKQLTEWNTVVKAKNSELAASLSKINEMTAAKTALDQKVEGTAAELKLATEAMIAAQSKRDASTGIVGQLQKQIETLQEDIARFNALPSELASKKNAIEQAMANAKLQLQPAEATIAASKIQLDLANGDVTKLEQQLATIQAMIVAEQAKRDALQSDMAGKQKALQSVQHEVERQVSDLDTIILQQQLFEQSFGKK